MSISHAQHPYACTTTSVEGTVHEAPLSQPANKFYLMEKANYAVRFPRITLRQARGKEPSTMDLKQQVMSGLIRADEHMRDYRWDYKAEVSFDMSRLPPTPFLSTSGRGQPGDPQRRHTLNPFPAGSISGLLRRPDVIIVKDRQCRWPGQAGADHQGALHPDNLQRVVEVKFPGDGLGKEQRDAYLEIAGGKHRFSVLEVHDCRDEGERQRDRQLNEQLRPTANRDSRTWPPMPLPATEAPLPVPVYGAHPIPRPARVESWTQQVVEAIDGLLEDGAQGIRQLSAEVQQHLEEAATWLSSKGQWFHISANNVWVWIDETGKTLVRWTDERLRALWREVQHYTDLTLEMLDKVDWVQVLVDVGMAVGTVVIAFVVAGALVTAGIPAALVSGLLVLVRLGQLYWTFLAGILGAGATSSILAIE